MGDWESRRVQYVTLAESRRVKKLSGVVGRARGDTVRERREE